VPKSKVRRKDTYQPKAVTAKARKPHKIGSGRWVAPLMVTLFLLGLAWIVVFYITSAGSSTSAVPVIKQLGNWNILVGFGLIGGGFALSTRWR
jgi:hypothetical protein